MDAATILKDIYVVCAERESDTNWNKRLKVLETLLNESKSISSESFLKIFQDAKVQSFIAETVCFFFALTP